MVPLVLKGLSVYTNAIAESLDKSEEWPWDSPLAIQLDPKDSWSFASRGVSRGEMGDHRQAIRDFDRAIR